ncbi:serine protease inhibitor dipetalogastin-like [Periplaneta americana]|uniref:serine protease inhibitor dipetalogastin-like n=1 Tax=Periplaneta americana TaxID=6978 RepID=UPI0037E78093
MLAGLTLAAGFCEQELAYMFEDCTAFDNSRFFGGVVCGSDGGTYPNRMFVRCLNYQNGRTSNGIKVNYNGPCTPFGQLCPYSPFFKPICATDRKTYVNIEALSCIATLDITTTTVGVLYDGECEWDQVDPCVTSNWEVWASNRVCGNNGLTYTNIAQVRCLRKIEPDLEVVHDGGCSLQETLKTAARTKSKACWLARNRYEWNPLCGTDNITYPNPFILLCYQPEVKVQFQGECDSQTHRSCQKVNSENIRIDPDTAVCGSDGFLYKSEDHFVCAKAEDRYLWLQRKGMCTFEDDPCKQSTWYQLDAELNPVCASDGNTYVSPAAVWCAKQNHDPCLKILHDGPCIPKKEHIPYETVDCNDSESCNVDNVPSWSEIS